MAINNQNVGPAFNAETVNGNVTLSNIITYQHCSSQHPRPPEKIRINVFNPQHDFVGRTDELDILEREITSSTRKSRTTVVCGLGGVGKTQLVRKFIHRNQSTFVNIIWVESQQRASMENSMRKLAKELEVATESDEFDRVVEKVFNTLSSSASLIVFDNVEDRNHIPFAFRLATCEQKLSLIVTSRQRDWGDSVCVIPLGVFDYDDAKTFISNNLMDGLKNKENIETLVKELQYFPLALRQATAYINYERRVRNPTFTVADYIKIYKTSTEQLLSFDICQTDVSYTYDRTTFTTWDVTIKALERSGAAGTLALRILYVIAFFNPDQIRRDILFNLMKDNSAATMKILETEDNVISAVQLLVDYSLVSRVDCEVYIIQIHRLVQEVLKINLNKTNGETERVLCDGLGLIEEMIDRNALHECHEHAILVFTSALKFEELVKRFCTIPHQILFSLNECGKTIVASDFGEKILNPFTDFVGADDLYVVLTKRNLAYAYNDRGSHSHALKMFEEVYSTEKRLYGKENHSTIETLKNIGDSNRDLGKHKEAKDIFYKVYDWRKTNLGEMDSVTLRSKHDIAFSNRTLGKFTEALKMFKELYAERVAVLGETDPETILTVRNIASLYVDLGRHSEALQLYLDVLDKEKTALARMENGNEYYPQILKTNFYIASAYRELGNYSEAMKIFQTLLDERKRIFGEDHPETILTEENIATVYLQSGETSEALKIYEDVLNKRKKVYEKDDQMCLMTEFNIAQTLRHLGKYSEALQLLEQILVKQKNLFRDDNHPQVLKTEFYRVLTTFDLEKRPEIVHEMKQILARAILVFGESHPESLKARFHIATSNRHLGKYSEVLDTFLDILDKQKNIFGDGHPETLKTKFSVGLTYYLTGRYSEALVALQDVFIARKNLFGENNTETIEAKNAIATVRSRKYSKTLQIVIFLLLLQCFVAYGLFPVYG